MSRTPFDSLNAGYVQDLYERYSRNPRSVPEAWRRFFSRSPEELAREGLLPPEGLAGNGARDAVARRASGDPGARTADEIASGGAPVATGREAAAAEAAPEAGGVPGRDLLSLVARATSLVQAFRDHGHQLARVDPLGGDPPGHPQLDPEFYGTTMDELEEVPASVVLSGPRDESLAEALRRLEEAYTGPVGFEFEHLEDPGKVRWLWSRVESGVLTEPMDEREKVGLLRRLAEVEGLEQFIHRTYLGQKRFSVEGNDMLVPMLDWAIRESGSAGAREVVVGMAHRGRLNVLAHIVGVSYEEILTEFEGGINREGALAAPGTGDVKYHHGHSGDYPLPDGGSVHINLVPNPSHLEYVNPVVEGFTRVHQFEGPGQDAEQQTECVLPILIHGDAAFAAEGVVAETLNLGRLRGYTTGGTIHVIVNNQIGFTTTPGEGRSTRYASDLAKGYDFPVIHVNADRPEACLAAIRLALAYRAEFHDDVVIDLIGYRRHGHNEGDEPAYTQPRLYDSISDHPTVREQWARQLVEEEVLGEEEAERIPDSVAEELREIGDRVKANGTGEPEEDPSQEAVAPLVDTAVDPGTLERINETVLTAPDGFTVHPKLARQFEKRREDFGPDFRLEWSHAENLAFGSLLLEGVPVRLTGQDSERGTFSQRHAVLHDVENGERHIPLARLGEARFEIYNSPLSEAGVVGFEYGYSVGAERDLVLWEAQFGDFVNAAQVAVDQFIASGWEKWGQEARLVLLLPHGYEGQGPEHSSARLERFLQLCAEDNMRVAYPTTPAQYFHLLRRQAHADRERPLVVMTPKSLLRHPRATSPVSDLTEGSFRTVLDDPTREEGAEEEVRRLVLCSGKLYYDLEGSDLREETADTAVARVEELYPFPAEALERIVGRFPSLDEVIWAQEEPRNMGALAYIGPRLRSVVPRKIRMRHVSRPDRASPAEGSAKVHRMTQERIVREALAGEEAGS